MSNANEIFELNLKKQQLLDNKSVYVNNAKKYGNQIDLHGNELKIRCVNAEINWINARIRLLIYQQIQDYHIDLKHGKIQKYPDGPDSDKSDGLSKVQ